MIGGNGPVPDFLAPYEGGPVVYFSYVFDSSAVPVSSDAISVTYAGLEGTVFFSASDIRPLHDVTLVITRDEVRNKYRYDFSGLTAEGWDVVHFADSASPDFVPNFALPTSTPQFPDEDPYTAGYTDVWGPNDEWTVYSDSDLWFQVAVFAPVNRATGGTATASKQKLPSEGAAQAFDGSKYTKWFASNVTTGWLQYRFGSSDAWTVIAYDLTSAGDVANRDPQDWQLQGSHDGIAWATLDSRTGELFSARRQTKRYQCSNSTPYEYYRLSITKTRGAGGGIQLAEFALLSY